MKQKNNLNDFAFVALAVLLVFSAYLLFRELYVGNLNDFAQEILVALLGSVIVVASMVVTFRLQAKQDKEREFNRALFEQKLQIYQTLLTTIFEVEDDNRISKAEVLDVENQVGVACLVANENLVSKFAQFVYQFKVYGVMYFRSMTEAQKKHFAGFVEKELAKPPVDSVLAWEKHQVSVKGHTKPESYFLSLDDLLQGIRSDLAVVEGDIQRSVEHFVKTGYDAHGLMVQPNIIDEGRNRTD